MKLELTEQEATALLQMINIAVKAVGLEAAEAGVHFKNKLQQAVKNAEVQVQNTDE